MLIEIIIFLIFGTIFGTFTGLIPGIHINLIGTLILSLIPFFPNITPILLVTFIVSMSITHTFIDFIPSIFLGCADTDTELSILPGHKLLKQGLGYEAILLTTYGSISAILLLLIILPLSIIFLPQIYQTIQKFIPYLLILISIFLILLEKRKISAIKIFFLTGILGLCTLNIETLNQPLLPLLSGLFGASTIILSIKNKIEIPKQIIVKPKITSKKPFLACLIASPFCSFLPGLGSSQAAIIGNTFFKTDTKNFLVLIGATNTLVMSFSFISLYLISKTRTGAAATIKEILNPLLKEILILIIITIIISSIISFFLTKKLAKLFSIKISKINYSKLSIITLIILTIIIYFVSEFFGIIIFAISTLTGIYSIKHKVKRTQMMGCLIIPTIINYLIIL